MSVLVVLNCGTKITTELGKVEGIITAVSIRFEKVNYEISYFINGEYKNAWLDRNEFSVKDYIGEINVGYK